MRKSYWLVVGLPAFGMMGGSESVLAADPAIKFAVVSRPETSFWPESSLPSSPEATAVAGDYRLSFQPPALGVSDTLPPSVPNTDGAIAPASAVTSQRPSVTASPVPTRLTPPPDPVPLGDPTSTQLPPPPLAPEVTSWFVGGEHSLVAMAIGHAEGTRTATGDRTPAYYGHVDPGNHAWNQGSFSYQHGARSPEEADQKQLARLKQHTQQLHHLAYASNLVLNQPEFLNAIDLANQAPEAALDRGYIDWLRQAKMMGLRGDEAILWARTRSFLDPDTGRWNAPGLGNSVDMISRDQERRQRAIARVISAYQQPNVIAPNRTFTPETPAKPVDIHAEAIDMILRMDSP